MNSIYYKSVNMYSIWIICANTVSIKRVIVQNKYLSDSAPIIPNVKTKERRSRHQLKRGFPERLNPEEHTFGRVNQAWCRCNRTNQCCSSQTTSKTPNGVAQRWMVWCIYGVTQQWSKSKAKRRVTRREKRRRAHSVIPVSYTHLTLPTKLAV